MKGVKVLSLTHAEDLDGIGSQAILYRFFRLLKNPMPSGFFNTVESTSNNNTDISLICLRTDYDDYLHYWAAILAQNTDKLNSEMSDKYKKEKISFNDRWREFYYKITDGRREFGELISKTRENILDLKDEMTDFDLLIITDLGLNQSFHPILPLLDNSSIEIAYFDHHEHSPGFRKFFSQKSRIYEVDNTRCATQILYKFLYPESEDSVSKKIMELAMDSDFQHFDIPETDKLQSIISNNMYDYDCLDLIMESMTAGTFWSREFEEIHDKVQKWELQERKKLNNQVHQRIIGVTNGDIDCTFECILGISKLRPSRTIKFIEDSYTDFFGHPINKSNREPFYLTLSLNTMNLKMNIRSNHFNVYKVAKEFGGGGHIERAGFTLPKAYLKGIEKDEITFENIKINKFIAKIEEIIKQQIQNS